MEHRPNCGGELKIIAAILEAAVIERIPHPSGSTGPRAAAGSGACADVAPRGLIEVQALRSGGPAHEVEGAGCVWRFLGPAKAL